MLISYKKPKGRFFIVGKPGGSPAVMRHISIQSSDNNYGYIEVDGVSGDYTATLNAGTQLSLRAVPNNITGDGREVEFSEWAGNNYDFENPTTYTVSGDDTITANFHIERYIYVTVDSSKYTIFREEFQTMTQDFTDAVISGGCKEYEVIPETGYQFDGWLIDGVLDSDTSNPRYFCDEGYDYTVEPSVSAATPAQPNDEIWYTSTDGNVVTPYIADFGTGITVTSNTYADGKGVIKLSGNATTIGNNAFNSCTTLETINIPSSVTSIGNQSFRSCSGLTTIDIPNSIISIGYQTFQDCIGLTSITIGSGLTAIGSYDFSGCTGLISVNIPNTITEIGRQAFRNCTSLTSVTFGTGLTKLIYGSFEGCTSLTTIDIPDNVTFLGHFTFSGCSGLTSVTIPDNVTSIGDYVFYGCSGLTSVTIPDSITSIGDSAFSGCSGLTSVTIPDSITSIGDSAFSGCSGLTSVTIPDSVTIIGKYVFKSCSGLTSVTIGSGIRSIGITAFGHCSNLTSITCEATTPPSLGRSVFLNTNDCPIYVPAESVTAYQRASGWSAYSSRIQAIPE